MNLLTDLPQILIGVLSRITRMFLAWIKSLQLRRSTFVEKLLFPTISVPAFFDLRMYCI